MIRRFVFLLIVCFMLFSIVAYADVISEPPRNNFYTSHSSECVELNQAFYASGENGSISLESEPGSKNEVVKINNGNIIFIKSTYNHNGETWGWGYFDYYSHNGWVLMNRLSGECVYLITRFSYANGKNGSVSLKSEPGSKNEVTKINNGEIINIMFTYNYKGETWGFTRFYSEEEEKLSIGWVLVSELLVEYDYASFAEDHKDEFHPLVASNYETVKNAKLVYLWSWPGCGKTRGDPISNYIYDISYVYTDKEGRDWGFLPYLKHYPPNSWICLSDPSNSEIPAFNQHPELFTWQSENIGVLNGGFSMQILIIILIVILLIGTAILIRVFWKPNKSR